MADQAEPKRGRGFESWTPEQRRAAASKGGKAAKAAGTAHRYTSEEAAIAGRKGGRARADRVRRLEAEARMQATPPVEGEP